MEQGGAVRWRITGELTNSLSFAQVFKFTISIWNIVSLCFLRFVLTTNPPPWSCWSAPVWLQSYHKWNIAVSPATLCCDSAAGLCHCHRYSIQLLSQYRGQIPNINMEAVHPYINGQLSTAHVCYCWSKSWVLFKIQTQTLTKLLCSKKSLSGFSTKTCPPLIPRQHGATWLCRVRQSGNHADVTSVWSIHGEGRLRHDAPALCQRHRPH